MREPEGMRPEGTRTGEELAAALKPGEKLRGGESAPFVDTCRSAGFSPHVAGVAYRLLARPFHRFFEMPYRALEQEP